MLAALAERIEALGPRFRLPFLAVQAVEAQSGRRGVLTFACDQDDLEWPPNTRRLKRLSRRVDKILATMKARLEA